MKRKRDYQRKNFRNPFFNKKGKTHKRRPWLVLILFLVIFFISSYFLNNISQLQIKTVQIKGNEHISQQEIEGLVFKQAHERRLFFFSQNNLIFFSKRELKKKLNENYFLEQLKIHKKYPGTLIIEIKEEISSLIWSSGGIQYYLDLKGVALRKATTDDLIIEPGAGEMKLIRPQVSSGQYPLIYDQSNTPVTIGQPIITEILVNFIINLTEQVKQRAEFILAHYQIPDPSSTEITLVTNEGLKIYFRLTDPLDQQLETLFSVLNTEVKDWHRLEYIDLRFGGKVFWK
ncbi:MAG: FtsQ-type POTRA domain-containing protein [Patescibacteria group bacterium]